MGPAADMNARVISGNCQIPKIVAWGIDYRTPQPSYPPEVSCVSNSGDASTQVMNQDPSGFSVM